MLCEQELYGDDIDGKRGVILTHAVLEESDTEDIKAQLEMMYEPGISVYTITLYCHMYETEHEFEANINDYFTPTELKELPT